MENITVESCDNCPFYSDDSDYGSTCYFGVDLSYNLTREDQIFVKHGVGNCVQSSIPKKCPLLSNSITISISEIYNTSH